MNPSNRKTGLEIVGDVPWGTHFCQFYQTRQDLLDILVPYFCAGLKDNEFCMWITSEPLDKAAAEGAMTTALPDFETYVQRGQIEIIPYSEWYLRDGKFDSERVLADWVKKLEAARAAGYEGLRLTGNTFWLEQKDWRAFTDYEAAVDGVIGRYRMLAACTYSIDRCGFNEILDVIRNHRFALVRREGRWELVESGERRRAQEDIRRLAQFPEQNPNPVFRLALEGGLIYANPPARELLGAMGAPAGGQVSPSVGALAAEAAERCGVVEGELTDGRGRTYWFAAIRPGGEPYVNLYARDITERKQAEEEVRRGRESLRVTLTSIGDAVIAADTEGRITFLNPAASSLTGWADDEALGRPIREVFRIVSEISHQPAEDIFGRVLEEERAITLSNSTALLTRDGREVPIEDSAAPIHDASGNLAGVVLVFHDVTAKREAQRALLASEEKYRLLFQNMAEGFALYELLDDETGRPVDWRVLEVNDAYTRHTGIPRERIVGRRISELFPAAIEDYLPVFARVVAARTPESFETFAKAIGRYQRVYTFPAGGRRFASTIEDISERKSAEDALRESEERFRNLFSSMTEGFAVHEIITDEKGEPVDYRFLDLNPAFERLTGFRRSEVVGRQVTEVLPGIEPFWIERYGRVALTGEPDTFERYFPAPLDRWYQVYAYRPALRRFAVIFMDVSDRKRAERASRESEERLRQTQEIAHLGSWELDLASQRLTWSDEVYRIFGMQPGQFGATYSAFLEAVHPDDRAAVDSAYSSSLGEGRESYEIEHRIVRRDTGEIRLVHEKGEHRRDASGRIVRSIGMIHDITEMKKAELLRRALAEQERLRLGAAVEQASDSVVMVDLDGRIQYVNTAFESINKVARAGAVGSSYFDHLAGGSPAAAAIREAIAQGRPWHGHLSGSVAGGRPTELDVTISPAMDLSGKVTGGLITEKDVTQENALQRQVRQTQKMEALGTLAGGITHDFNNILSTIYINTELALLDLDPANPARRSLPIVLQAADRGRELVKQIITFSRQREWERKPLEVAPIIKEGMKLLRSTLPKNIAIHESIVPDGGPILADPSQVHQVLVNLCQNAALAMSESTGQLEVKLEPVHVDAMLAARHPDLKPGPYVRLTVGDNGCGMTGELVERIFEPFFTTRKHGEGSGLGLAVVHGIVKSYDGAITVYSEPGKGSVFNVYIPRLEGKALAGEKGKRVRPEKGEEHILLVEDEEAQLNGMTRLLERLGYRVTAKSTGRAALTAFKKNPEAFDLVITDQTMPRMTGAELAKALVKIRPDLPIVLCTGFSEKVNGETVGDDGIRSFVMKPFSIEEISKHIRAAIKKGSEAD